MHAPPQSCSRTTLESPPCTCPEFEPSSDSELVCDLCDHQVEWHLPPLALTQQQGRELKARGEDALEHCKDRLGQGGALCPCPVFVAGSLANECALCTHKKGWHKFKDVGSTTQQPNTALTSPAPSTSSIRSSVFATSPGSPIDAFPSNPSGYSPPMAPQSTYRGNEPSRRPSISSSPLASPITTPGTPPQLDGDSPLQLRRLSTSSTSNAVVNDERGATSPLRMAPAISRKPLVPPPTIEGGPKRWGTYDSKNMQLLISPPILDGQRVQPGQVLSMQLRLGPKVSLANYDKIDVKLIGNSFVYGLNMEPPDMHDFLTLQAFVFPPSPEITEIGQGQRVFSWTMTIPEYQNCNCGHGQIPLPSSYGHSHFRVDYRIDLTAKRHKKLGMNSTEKTSIPFPVFAPYIGAPDLKRLPSNTTITSGVEGRWQTISYPKIILVDGQQAAVTNSKLAWQVLPPENNLTKILYRITLHFGQISSPQHLSHQALGRLSESIRFSISRCIALSRYGRPPTGNDVLPALKVAFTEEKDGAEVRVNEDRSTMWCYKGYLEVNAPELRSMTTCNASIRYTLSAKVLPTAGLSTPLDLIARNLCLEVSPAQAAAQLQSVEQVGPASPPVPMPFTDPITVLPPRLIASSSHHPVNNPSFPFPGAPPDPPHSSTPPLDARSPIAPLAFDQFTADDEDESTPAYEEAVRLSLVEQENQMVEEDLLRRTRLVGF